MTSTNTIFTHGAIQPSVRQRDFGEVVSSRTILHWLSPFDPARSRLNPVRVREYKNVRRKALIRSHSMKIEPTKDFACKLSIMLDSKLIWYKHFQLFCDDIILEYIKPPYWIIELATVRFQGSAIEIVNKYINSEPFIDFYNSELFNQYIACLYLKYDRREISWASFLFSSGQYADNCQAVKEPCKYFYDLLSEYEDSEFRIGLEYKQKEEIQNKFLKEIKEIQAVYDVFRDYFKQFIIKERNASL
ncbi:hypothetical protein D3C73_647860 [compost metagenome]